jgi:hypothetical protein
MAGGSDAGGWPPTFPLKIIDGQHCAVSHTSAY